MADGITKDEMRSLFEEFFGGKSSGNSRAKSIASKEIGNEFMSIDDYDEIVENYKSQTKEDSSSTEQYLSKKRKLIEIEEKLVELEEYKNNNFQKRNELLEKLKKEGLSDDEQKQLDEINEKMNEWSECTKKQIELQSELKKESAFSAIGKDVGGAIGAVGGFISSLKGVKSCIMDLISPYTKLNNAVSQYAKNIGLTGEGMKALEDRIQSFAEGSKIHEKYNISQEEIAKLNTSYASKTGKSMRLSDEDFENLAAARLVAGEEKTVELASKLENFGVSASDTAEKLGKMHQEAAKTGLSFETYSNNVANNIKMAQNYTFKNGIKGLESMAKKATAMKLDMQQVANLANQVSTVEGAVQTSAKLQVLGGPFAQLADPMGMLNEGLNDIEGLQDRVIKMIGGLGQFDKETGQVKVSSFNRIRIQEAAKAMGMDSGALMESVHAQGKRNEIGKAIESTSELAGISDELKELIKNTGTFKDGKAGISVSGKFTALEDIDPKKAEELKETLRIESQGDSDNIRDIAQSVRSAKDVLEGQSKLWEALKSNMFEPIVEMMLPIVEWFGEHKTLLKVLIGIAAAVGISNAVGGVFNSLGRFGKLGKKAFNGAKGLFSKGGSKAASSVTMSVPQGAANRIKPTLNVTGSLPKGAANTIKPISNVTEPLSKGVSKTSSIFKGGMARTGKRALIKTIGKQGATKMLGVGAKLGRAAAAGGGIASVGTVLGAVGDIATDSLVDKGKIKKGGAAHHALSAGSNALSGAAMGAAIGSIIPGIGTAIGAAVGGVAGAIKGLWKSGAIKQAYNGVRNFARKSMDKIKNSKVGKAVGNAVNKFKKTAVGKVVSKVVEYSPIGLAAKGVGKLLGLDKKKSSLPPKPKQNKLRSSSLDILNQYVGKVKPVLDKGAINTAAQVAKTNNDVHVTSDPHDIKLNGTLNLKGENGQSYDLMTELKNNPTLKRQLTDMISNEMGVISKGGYVAQGV